MVFLSKGIGLGTVRHHPSELLPRSGLLPIRRAAVHPLKEEISKEDHKPQREERHDDAEQQSVGHAISLPPAGAAEGMDDDVQQDSQQRRRKCADQSQDQQLHQAKMHRSDTPTAYSWS